MTVHLTHPTVRAASAVLGPQEELLHDPAEHFHEASKLYPSTVARQAAGVRRLELSPELCVSATRSVKRRARRPIALPAPEPPRATLGEALAARRSVRSFSGAPISSAELSALLHSAYGLTDAERASRSAPSGGALYPLDVYCAADAVAGLTRGIYHFDPLRHSLAWLSPPGPLADALIAPPLEGCAATFLVAAAFWRTRFKYGLRGYRFALIEVGHLAQNLLLACAALGLAGAPFGGFYDARMDELLGLDGLHESSLYAVCVGRRRETG